MATNKSFGSMLNAYKPMKLKSMDAQVKSMMPKAPGLPKKGTWDMMREHAGNMGLDSFDKRNRKEKKSDEL